MSLGLLSFCGSSYSFALAGDATDKYKAAFLFSFVKYIENDTGHNNICIVDDAELFSLIKSKPNAKILSADSPELRNCALVYVDRQSSDKISSVLKNTAGQQVITVSDSANFINKGGIVEMFEDSGKLKFILNIKKATALKFKVNSKLVEIADKTL